MYERTFWLDHVEDQSGEVIQEGTPLDQAHFNKMAVGLAMVIHEFQLIRKLEVSEQNTTSF